MKIYIELAILENFIINLMLLFLTAKFFKLKVIKTNFICGSLFGTIFALIFPLLKVNSIVLFCLKILLGFVIVYIAFIPQNWKKFIQLFVSFVFLTFVLGGAVFAIYDVLNVDLSNFKLISSGSALPLIVFVLCVYVFYLIVKKFIILVFRCIKVNKLIYNVEITLKNKKEKVQAFFDSGNTLKDDKCNLPICIISQNLFKKLYPDGDIIKLILRKQIDLDNGHYIFYSTVAKKDNVMFVFKPDELKIFNGDKWILCDCLLGVSLKNFANNNFEILLNGFCGV